jgi:hypothetical protein
MMMEYRKLDISSVPNSTHDSNQDPSCEKKTRPFLGIRFDCCRTYGRIYRCDTAMSYQGRCPKCLKPIKVKVGSGGTSNRFFNAS